MSKNILIRDVNQNKRTVEVIWEDGKKSNFHFLWLRDNCPYGIHPSARQRRFNFLNVSEKIYPKNVSITNDGKLQIIWSEGNHTSHYEPKWLRNNCYKIKNEEPYISPYLKWDSKLNNDLSKITIEYEEVMDSDEGLLKWLKQLHQYGFSILHKVPTKNKSALKILNKISHIRETFFGTPFEVINIPNPNNTAYTSESLRNHTDLPYYEYVPGYQFLHCLINEAEGGFSSAVDGFFVADFLKKNEPEIFEILINTPAKFKDNDYTQKSIRIFHSPLITLNKDKDYNDIRFSIATMGAMDCAPEIMDNFYLAYRKFAQLLHNNKFIVKFRLDAGDMFCFNNRRILHGRTEFDPNSGHRHLQGYYIDRDDILGKINYLNKVEI